MSNIGIVEALIMAALDNSNNSSNNSAIYSDGDGSPQNGSGYVEMTEVEGIWVKKE